MTSHSKARTWLSLDGMVGNRVRLIVTVAVLGAPLGGATANMRSTDDVRKVASLEQMFTFVFDTIYYDGAGIVVRESFSTTALSDQQAFDFCSAHMSVRAQAIQAQTGRRVNTRGTMIDKQPIRPGGPLAAEVAALAGFYAACAVDHGTAGWAGPIRRSYADARRDALAHEASNRGHTSDVLSASGGSADHF